MMEIYDISQDLREGMTVWPGDPEFRRRPVLRIPDGASSNVSAVDMGAHTGTHVDAPLHLSDLGKDIASMPIHYFVGPARVFSLAARGCIRKADLSELDWKGVQRALFKTRPGASSGADDGKYVYFAPEAAEFLAGKGVLLVGTDAPSVDAFDCDNLPAHRALLNHGTVILEGIRLDAVPPGDYELICLPLKLTGFDGSPVRAILRKQEKEAFGS